MSDVVLAVIQARRGRVLDASLSALGAAVRLKQSRGDRLVIGVVDQEPDQILLMLDLGEADEVLTIRTPGPGFDAQAQESAVMVFATMTRARTVLFGHSPDAMAVAPAVAARLQFWLATDITALAADESTLRVRRPLIGGRLDEELALDHGRAVLTVRSGVFEPPAVTPEGAPVPQGLEAPSMNSGTTHLGWNDPDQGSVEVTRTDLILSVGRAIGSKENASRAEALAVALGGTMAASGPVAAVGWTDSSRKVGRTGKRIRPKVYLAMGISGAAEHIMGMADSETVIVVNTDPSAPIVEYADYVVETDIMEFIGAMESALRLGPRSR